MRIETITISWFIPSEYAVAIQLTRFDPGKIGMPHMTCYFSEIYIRIFLYIIIFMKQTQLNRSCMLTKNSEVHSQAIPTGWSLRDK